MKKSGGERETRILDSLNDLILVYGADGRVLYVNDTVCRTLGWTRARLLGRKVSDIVAPPYDRLLSKRTRKLKAEGELVITTAYRRANGGVYPAETRCSLTAMGGRPCVLCMARGIPRGARPFEDLEEARERYRRLVEGLKGEYFFYQHDARGVFTYISPSIRSVLGYTREQFLEHYTRFLTDNPVNRDVVKYTRESLKGNPQPPYRLEIRDAAGRPRWLEVLEVPIRGEDGRVAGVEGIAHDITSAVKANAELTAYRSGLEKIVAERTAELKAVFDRTPVLIILLDSDLKVVRTNAASHPGNLVGDVLRCVNSKGGACGRGRRCGDCQVRRAVSGTLRTGKPVSRVEAGLETPGGRVHFLLSTAMIDAGGERQLLICLDDITPQKNAEESLRKSEEFRRLILRSVGDGIIGVDRHGKILFMNEAAEAMLGWTLAELSGKNLHTLIHARRADGSRYPLSECPMYAAYTDRKSSVIQDEMLWRRDGTGFYVRYSASPMYSNGEVSGAVITFSDMTERRRIERELRATKERLQVQNAALAGLARARENAAADLDGAFREAAETAASALETDRVSVWLFNEDKSELSCRAIYEKAARACSSGITLAAADYPAFFRLLGRERLIAVEAAASDFRLRELRESYVVPKRIGSMLCAAVNGGSGVVGVISAERVGRTGPWSPDEQTMLGAVADFAALAISAAERHKLAGMKDFLTHTIVHDLRNPLSSIIAAGQILQTDLGERLSGEQRESLRILNSLAEEMCGMVSNILDINRLEEGKLPLKAESVRPEALVKEAAAGLKPAADGEDKKIRTRAAAGLPELKGDKALLRRVLENLLANALKFSAPLTEIEAGVRQAGGALEFFVGSSGPEIPAEYRERVFEKFVQLEDPSPRKWTGKGLGLAFCKLAVEAHGGRIWVEPRGGGGNVFRFLVPLKRV